MFVYNKKLQYPVKIERPNPRLASLIISQYGGPDGELGASLRYLSQRYSMPFDELKGLLTDIGIEDYFCSSQYFYRTTQDTTSHNKRRQYNNITMQPIPPHYKSIKYNTGSLTVASGR